MRFRGASQCIVTLLLLVAIIPEPSAGQFCYECEKKQEAGEQCVQQQIIRADKLIKPCSENQTYCHVSGVIDYRARGCYSKVQGDCFKKYVKATCYDPVQTSKEITENVKTCAEAAGEPLDLGKGHEICICSGSLSNQGNLGEETKPCRTEVPNVGPVNGTGIQCYKCEGDKKSDCGQEKIDKIQKVNCPDWKLGGTTFKAACFKSRAGGGGKYVKGCGFYHQLICRSNNYGKNCTLTQPEILEDKDKVKLNETIAKVKACEEEAVGNLGFNLRTWYNKQPKNSDRELGHLGVLQEEIGKGNIHPAYKDCVCAHPLCNGPGGRSASNWGVIMAMVFLGAGVLNGELFLGPLC